MRKRQVGFLLIRMLTTGVLAAGASTSMAGGFALIEQSASQQGNAYAGASAFANDASTIYFNPAGMTRIRGQQAIAGAHIITTSFQFENDGSKIGVRT